jgi:hypothetical protein
MGEESAAEYIVSGANLRRQNGIAGAFSIARMRAMAHQGGETFQCESCSKRYRVKPELAGKKVRCSCGATMRMPAPATPEAEPDNFGLDDLASLGGAGRPSAEEEAIPEPAAFSRAVAAPKPATPRRSFNWRGLLNMDLTGGFKIAPDRIVGIVCLAIGAIMLGITFLKYSQHDEFTKTAKPITATISGEPQIIRPTKLSQVADHDKWRFVVPVTLKLDKTYPAMIQISGESNLPGGLKADKLSAWKGTPVEIFYDPNDPTHVEVPGQYTSTKYYISLAVGVLFSLFGVYALFFTSGSAASEKQQTRRRPAY